MEQRRRSQGIDVLQRLQIQFVLQEQRRNSQIAKHANQLQSPPNQQRLLA